MPTFTYPTDARLTAIAQDFLPRLMEGRVGFDLMPLQEDDNDVLLWEQMDNFTGLQQIRGINGAPQRVARVGIKRYRAQPGYYGEFKTVDEAELTRRRPMGIFGNQPIEIGDLVQEIALSLQVRELDLQESIIWTLLTTGTYAVANGGGTILQTDTYPVQSYTAGTTWATAATATPLADFRAIQLLGPAHSTEFNGNSTAYMSRITLNNLLTNINSADLYGRRVAGLATVNNAKDLNTLLLRDDLPQIEVYDKGYITDGGTFTRFLPTGKVVVMGVRPQDAKVGYYRMTRNVNEGNDGVGSYTMVQDSLATNRPPREIVVHRGHNGGPVIFFPGAVISMSV